MASDETVDAWYERYHAYRATLGRVPTLGQWRLWVSPRIGHLRMVDVTSDDVESIRDTLDEAVLAWHRDGLRRGERVSGCTAEAVWWMLVTAFRVAGRGKRRDLRVLAGLPNPCDGIEPPGDARTRRSRSKTFVYPAEAMALFSCALVPIGWREAHAVAAYTYLRPNELRVLRWHDIDLHHGRIRVSRAWAHHLGMERGPKTLRGIRDVPIPDALTPLLERMRRGRREDDLVVPILTSRAHETLAWRTREHLRIAGITRAALYETTRETVRANFRSWRDSGITWLAMSGLGLPQMMRRAGHEDARTTMRYVRLAEDMTGELGVPFGPLPPALVVGVDPVCVPSPAWCTDPRTTTK